MTRPGTRTVGLTASAVVLADRPPTELRVAFLVADGYSNPDIAGRLFLSRRTIDVHVSHILAKLAARSRVDIAREALGRQPTA
jgi:DNA-binding NarL/FixJ family response regulator